MRLVEIIELIKAYNQIIVDHQRNMIKALAEAIKLNTANIKLSPADAWLINVTLALQEPVSEDNHEDDPSIHIHGIC